MKNEMPTILALSFTQLFDSRRTRPKMSRLLHCVRSQHESHSVRKMSIFFILSSLYRMRSMYLLTSMGAKIFVCRMSIRFPFTLIVMRGFALTASYFQNFLHFHFPFLVICGVRTAHFSAENVFSSRSLSAFLEIKIRLMPQFKFVTLSFYERPTHNVSRFEQKKSTYFLFNKIK